MERMQIAIQTPETRSFKLPRLIAALVVGGALLLGPGRGSTRFAHAEDIVPNLPNAQGNYGPNAQPGECGPFTVPNWVEHNRIEYRCVGLL